MNDVTDAFCLILLYHSSFGFWYGFGVRVFVYLWNVSPFSIGFKKKLEIASLSCSRSSNLERKPISKKKKKIGKETKGFANLLKLFSFTTDINSYIILPYYVF